MTEILSSALEPLLRLRGQIKGTYELVSGEDVPEPFRGLLVHRGDMTSRLENFHRGPIGLRVMQSRMEEEMFYCREVVLLRTSDGGPVEYGAIEIFLGVLPEAVRERILEGKRPLGGILNAARVPYHSEPVAFFRMEPSPWIASIFEGGVGKPLYGRCNALVLEGGELIAKIVEILPAE